MFHCHLKGLLNMYMDILIPAVTYVIMGFLLKIFLC